MNLATGKQLLPQERIHWDSIDRARNIFKQKSKLHLWAVVMFDMGSSNYRKVDINPTAELLANTILEDLNVCEFFPPKVARKIYVRELKYKGLPHPQGIFSISYSIEDPKMEVWGPSYGYGVPDLTP